MESFNQYEITLLVSILNTKLRDYYSGLDALADDFEWSLDELIAYIEEKGYWYSPKINQIRAK